MSTWARYSLALVVTGLAVAVRAALDPWLGQQLPFITFFPAIAVVVWYAGAVPAALLAMAGVVAVNYLFLGPRLTLELIGMPTLAVHAAYVVSAALIIAMGRIARRRQFRNRQYQQALEESEARFRRLADSAPVLIWQTDRNKKGTYFNRTWLEYTGRALEDELGDGWLDSIHRDDLPALDACAQALDERRPFTTQFRLRAADGEYRWILDSGTPRFDTDGTFLGFIGSCTDIHDRKLAEESRAWLASIVSASTAAIVSKNLEGTILSWNAGAERLFGYTADEAVGRSIDLIIPPELEHEERSILERLRQGLRIEDFETTRLAKNGRRVEVLATISPVRDDAGRLVGASKVARDITEQRRTLAALRESEQRFGSFMSHLPGLAWIKDAEGRYIFANEAAQRAFGTRRDELYGHTDGEIFPPATAHHFRENDKLALKRESGIETVETMSHADGRVRQSLVSKFPITLPDGQILVGGIAIDITERRRAEQALRESDRRKDTFLTILGHELRNPLAPLRTGLALLGETVEDPRIGGVVAMMERQLMHLVRLVDDLLDVSRISHGKFELRSRPVALATIVAAAVEQARPAIDERGHALTVDGAAETLMVQGDPERLTQVLTNLLGNAAKYMDKGGSINVDVSAVDGIANIRVRDTGFGIPPERVATLFESFNQIPEHRSRTGGGGLGIGLALARQIVELHEGKIAATSGGLDRGSEFVVTLPLGESEAVASAPLAAPRPGNASRRILIVDDNIDAADSLRFLLEAQGHTVETAYDGPDALRAIVDCEPDIVLLDIGLPGMDGYEVAERIRAMPNGSSIQLCAVTGWGQAEDKQRALESGFDSHVTKPMDLATLSSLVAQESQHLA